MAITDLRLMKGRKRQQIPHLLIGEGSWRALRRPPGYPIQPDRTHTSISNTSHKAARPQPASSTILDHAANVENVLHRTVHFQLTSSTQPAYGNTSISNGFQRATNHPPMSSTSLGHAHGRVGNAAHSASNHPSTSSTPSKNTVSSIGNASQPATNRTPAPSAQSKAPVSSVEDASCAVTMADDTSRRVTRIQDLLN